MRSAIRVVSCALVIAAGCGARTGLETFEVRDGGMSDAFVGHDAAVCVPADPPSERCNGVDDDCDGRADEGLPYEPIAPAQALRTIEGDTGGDPFCSSCRWAWGPAIASVDGGLLVPFYLGIYGGREQPSLFARSTTPDGAPIGEVMTIGTSVPMHMQRWDTPGPDGSTWLDATLRVGSSDVPGWVVVARDGTFRVRELSGSAARAPSIALASGSIVDAWQTDTNVRVEGHVVMGDEIRTTSWRVIVPRIEENGLTSIAVAANEARTGGVFFVVRFTVEPRAFRLFAQRLGSDGEPMGELITLLEDGAPLQMRATTTEGGVLLFDPGNGSEPMARFVDASLTRVEEPTVILEGVDGSYLSFDSVRLPEGGHLVQIADALVRLDSRGVPTATWRGRLAPGTDDGNAWVTSPDLAVVDGRTFITWHGIAADDTPNTVWIRELACVEP